jgi:hypothetical protein
MLNEGGTRNVSGRPKIGGEHLVGPLEAVEGSHGVVLPGSRLAHTVGVDILDTAVLDNLLGDLGRDATGTSGSRDHADGNRAHLALNLGGDSVDTTDLGAPVATTDRDDLHLGVDEGALDGNLDFLADLDTETDVTLAVTASDDSLEAGTLTGLGLLLDGEDAHDLVGELSAGVLDEALDNLAFLDGDGVSVNLLKRLDETVLYETAEFGKGSPLFLAETATGTTGPASAAAAISSAASTAASTGSETSASGGSISSWCSAQV